MFLRKSISFAFIFLAGIMASCSDDSSSTDTSSDDVIMPVTLSIPASDGPTTRVGDPGTYEQFKLPQYAYIYIVCKNAAGNDVVVRSTPSLTDNWVKTKYSGIYAADGDSVYQYTGRMQVHLPVDRTAMGKVYVALSTVRLQGLPTGNEGYNTEGETEQTVQNYKFRLNSETNAELANIYSTPYNYRPDGTTYYGTMNDINTITPSINIVLYHVGAKLDLLWNVDEAIQKSTAITGLNLTLPDADSSYIFKPLETAPTTTRQESVNISVGNQWYGRDYLYVIPMTGTDNTYTFDALMTTTSGDRNSEVQAGVINKNQPFTPWMRGTISVK